MKILLDTNFILTCVKQKIDFVRLADEIFDEGLKWVLPIEVEEELKVLAERGGEKVEDKAAAVVGLQVVGGFDRVPLITKDVDSGIMKYAENNKVIVATMDKGLKERLPEGTKILTIRGKGNLGLV